MKSNIKTIPRQAKDNLHHHDRCVFALSVGDSRKSIPEIAEGYTWVSEHFDHNAILVGDSLYRITLQIQKGLDEKTASETAYQNGFDLVKSLYLFIKEEPLILRSSEISQLPRYRSKLEEVKKESQTNREFANELENDAVAFVERQKKNSRLMLSYENAIELSIRYLSEEIAMYMVLAEDGWNVEAYQGTELNILRKIITGEIKTGLKSLASRIHISLH